MRKFETRKLKINGIQDDDYSKAGIVDLNQRTKVECMLV